MGIDQTVSTVIITAKDETLAAWTSVRAEANKTKAEMQAFSKVNELAQLADIHGTSIV